MILLHLDAIMSYKIIAIFIFLIECHSCLYEIRTAWPYYS